jgi:predicted Zn finger-like uncharacterized protein
MGDHAAEVRSEGVFSEWLMKCPRCDYPRKPGDRECPKCGIDYAYVEKKMTHHDDGSSEDAENPESAPEEPVEAAKGKNMPEINLSKTGPITSPAPPASKNACPKCGFGNPKQALECLRCGIIFTKYEAYLEKKRQVEEETNQTTDGLLDPETIRAAAESSQPVVAAPVMAKTACPHCGQRYKIRDDQIGITTRCKKCSSIFKIEAIPSV